MNNTKNWQQAIFVYELIEFVNLSMHLEAIQ